MNTLTLTPEELAVLRVLLDFHCDDVPDADYSSTAFRSLCCKVADLPHVPDGVTARQSVFWDSGVRRER